MKKNNSIQEWLPFERILKNGIIKLKNNSYIKIIKIYPINFNLKSELEKEAILNSYKIFLKTCDFNFQILIQSKKEDLSKHISNINCQKEKEEKRISEYSNKYIEYIQSLNHQKKSSSKNNKKENTQPKVAEPLVPTQPLVAQAEVKPELPPVDVDVDIPVVKTDKNQNTYCVIIANENYEDVPVVDFASRDGEVFREYCIKTLGVPEKQIKTFINASYTDIKRALNWVETMTEISEGNSKVIFYYAGHGIPNEKDKAAYLIPTDGFPKDITTCFKLADIYSRLGKMHTKNITVLLDACFSGVKRGSGQALIAARGVALKPREEVLPPNMIVFTAASNDETALSYGEKRHGMFTYFLLDRLKKSKGETSFGDLFIHLSQNVKKNSMLENDKLQTPNVAYPNALGRKWESMTF